MLTAASCLSTRWSRIVFLLLCSPLLLPLLFIAIPLLCAVEIFSRYCSRKSPPSSAVEEFIVAADEEDDLRLRRCEEGCGGGCGGEKEEEEEEGSGLLQRYLEDQLKLARSIYDCGEDDDDGDDDQDPPDPIRVPLLS